MSDYLRVRFLIPEKEEMNMLKTVRMKIAGKQKMLELLCQPPVRFYTLMYIIIIIPD